MRQEVEYALALMLDSRSRRIGNRTDLDGIDIGARADTVVGGLPHLDQLLLGCLLDLIGHDGRDLSGLGREIDVQWRTGKTVQAR